jgi:high-affinity K+ transport system ATPase subunit B
MTSLAKEHTIALINSRFTNYALIALIFACLGFYVYLANAAVRTLAVLEKTKAEMQSLSVEVSEMEAKRLLADNNLSNVMAKKLSKNFIAETPFFNLNFIN